MIKNTWYQLPEADCERLTRHEMSSLKMLLAELSSGAWAEDNLQKRLECIPYGRERLQMAVGHIRAICNDVLGTIPTAQKVQIRGTMTDFEIRLMPKATPNSTNIVLTRAQGKDLVDMACERCIGCVEDGESCRKCKLYKFMEATTPLDDYGSGMTCPYSRAEWE